MLHALFIEAIGAQCMIAVCASAVHGLAFVDATSACLRVDDTGAGIGLEMHCLWEAHRGCGRSDGLERGRRCSRSVKNKPNDASQTLVCK